MRAEAAGAGTYKSPWGTHPKIQIVTVEELLGGARIEMPPRGATVTFKKDDKYVEEAPPNEVLFEAEEQAEAEGEDAATEDPS